MKKTILYGVGKYFAAHREWLPSDIEIIAYGDSYADKKKPAFAEDGKPILSPEEIEKIEFDELIICTDVALAIELCLFLQSYNIESKKIKMLCRMYHGNYENEKSFDKSIITKVDVENGTQIKIRQALKSDFWVFHEVIVEHMYDVNIKEDVVVIDFGMNIGIASLFFAAKENVKAVFGYEAFSDTYQQALDNISLNEDIMHKIHPYNIAVTTKEEERDIVVSHISSASRNIYSKDADKPHMKLTCRSAKSILKEIVELYPNTKLLIKCDTEGAEFDIFQSIGETDLLNRVDTIILEYHNSPNAILNLLDKYDFRYWRYGREYFGMIVAFKKIH